MLYACVVIMLHAHVVMMLYAHVVIMLYAHVVIMLYAHVVIMLYAHVVSSYYCTLGLYTCASVFQSIHMIKHTVLLVSTTPHFGNTNDCCSWFLAIFDSTLEDWTAYIECLHFYFDANGISDVMKKQAVLLSCCGPSTFRLL